MNQNKEKATFFFDNPENYLKNNYNIKFRSQIIRDFIGNRSFGSIIDVACGNGELSIPLLNDSNNLVLLDASKNMLAVAEERVPDHLKKNVEIIQKDITRSILPKNSFDLVLCVGLLAHIKNHCRVLEKLDAMTAPNGIIILQNTNASHYYSSVSAFFRWIGSLMDKGKYSYNHARERYLIDFFFERNYVLEHRFSYFQTFLIFDRAIPHHWKFSMLKKQLDLKRDFGFVASGNECLYCFRKKTSKTGG